MSSLTKLAVCTMAQWPLDFEGNLSRIVESIREAKRQGCQYRTGPELEVTGYGCEDHFLEMDTLLHAWHLVHSILMDPSLTSDILVDIGMPVLFNQVRYNCRVILFQSRIVLIRPKLFLANSGLYREHRWFSPWLKKCQLTTFVLPPLIQSLHGQYDAPFGDSGLQCLDGSIGFEICEELFTPNSPHIGHSLDGFDIISNSSASHYEFDKFPKRVSLLSQATQRCGGIYLYANQVGCDGGRMYYDGGSMIWQNGKLLAMGNLFTFDKVELVVANVNLEHVRQYRANMGSRCDQAILHRTSTPKIKLHFNLTQVGKGLYNQVCHLSHPLGQKDIGHKNQDIHTVERNEVEKEEEVAPSGQTAVVNVGGEGEGSNWLRILSLEALQSFSKKHSSNEKNYLAIHNKYSSICKKYSSNHDYLKSNLTIRSPNNDLSNYKEFWLHYDKYLSNNETFISNYKQYSSKYLQLTLSHRSHLPKDALFSKCNDISLELDKFTSAFEIYLSKYDKYLSDLDEFFSKLESDSSSKSKPLNYKPPYLASDSSKVNKSTYIQNYFSELDKDWSEAEKYMPNTQLSNPNLSNPNLPNTQLPNSSSASLITTLGSLAYFKNQSLSTSHPSQWIESLSEALSQETGTPSIPTNMCAHLDTEIVSWKSISQLMHDQKKAPKKQSLPIIFFDPNHTTNVISFKPNQSNQIAFFDTTTLGWQLNLSNNNKNNNVKPKPSQYSENIRPVIITLFQPMHPEKSLLISCYPCDDHMIFVNLQELSASFLPISLKKVKFQVNFDRVTKPLDPILPMSHEEEIAKSGSSWIWDYLSHCGNMAGFLVPLSGGADSAAVAALVSIMCHRLIEKIQKIQKKQRLCDLTQRLSEITNLSNETLLSMTPSDLCYHLLHTCYLPTIYSSAETRNRAQEIANTLHTHHHILEIDPIVSTMLNMVEKYFNDRIQFEEDGGTREEGLAIQNIQARLRMVTTYTLAQLIQPKSIEKNNTTKFNITNGNNNYNGHDKIMDRLSPKTNKSLLVLATSNIEETLRGYFTKYDCSSGDLNPIGGLSKINIIRFLQWTFDTYQWTIMSKVSRATPTAELKPLSILSNGDTRINQEDEIEMGLSYSDISIMGKLRIDQRLGPYSMFLYLRDEWHDQEKITKIAEKVKHFFKFYAINRHKTSTLPPCLHSNSFSVEDHRYDLRPILIDPRWQFQFKMIDQIVDGDEEGEEGDHGEIKA